jgi:hypothetical protein
MRTEKKEKNRKEKRKKKLVQYFTTTASLVRTNTLSPPTCPNQAKHEPGYKQNYSNCSED